MTTAVIVQARMTSTRLPGKVMLDLGGRPVLEWVVARARRARLVDQVALAVPDAEASGVLREWAASRDVPCVAGPEEDVLARYVLAGSALSADVIVRITSDCPFIDWTIIDAGVSLLESTGAGYVSNTLVRTYPRGLDVEVCTMEALVAAHAAATRAYEREHVTPYIKENPDLFRQVELSAPMSLRRPDLRMTIDTQEDLRMARALVAVTGSDRAFRAEAVELLEIGGATPGLFEINADVQQKSLS